MKRFFSLLAVLCLVFCFGSTAMAVHTHSKFIQGVAEVEPGSDNEVFVISNQLAFSGLTPFSTGGVTTADVVNLLRIPAGTYVLDVGMRTVTAPSMASTTGFATIGDSSDVDGWISIYDIGGSSSGVSTSNDSGVSGAYKNQGGKYYSAAGNISMTIPTLSTWDWLANDPQSICTGFVIQPWAICIKPSTQQRYK